MSSNLKSVLTGIVLASALLLPLLVSVLYLPEVDDLQLRSAIFVASLLVGAGFIVKLNSAATEDACSTRRMALNRKKAIS